MSATERNRASELSKQRRASKWVGSASQWVSGWGNGTVLYALISYRFYPKWWESISNIESKHANQNFPVDWCSYFFPLHNPLVFILFDKRHCTLFFDKHHCALLFGKCYCAFLFGKSYCALLFGKCYCALLFDKRHCALLFNKRHCTLLFDKCHCA